MASTLPVLCLDEIFQNLIDERSCLAACCRVNYHWSGHAIRVLWGQKNLPYSNTKFFSTLISCLNKNNAEKISGPISKPFTHYTSFLHDLDMAALKKSTAYWCLVTDQNVES